MIRRVSPAMEKEVAQQWRRRLSSDGQGESGKILYSAASISGTLYKRDPPASGTPLSANTALGGN